MPLPAGDLLGIHALLARYNHAIDGRDTETWLDCFTDDAVYEFPPDRSFEGKEQLRAIGEQRRSAGSDGAVPDSRHWLSNIAIDGDGDRASVRCYLALIRPEDPPRINHTGVYDFEVERAPDGRWRFTRRTMVRDA